MYRTLIFFIILLVSCAPKHQLTTENTVPSMPENFDWQGHRGARGLLPENTTAAFEHALEYHQLTTLELDLAVSKNRELIVSHEPWMSAQICSFPDGQPVTKKQEDTLRIYTMTTAEVQAFDCGKRGHSEFPEQTAQAAYKPTLKEVVKTAEAKARELDRPLPFYNIEIKSKEGWDNTHTPVPAEFAALVIRELARLGIAERTTVQSFDIRSLQAVKAQAPNQRLAYLVANRNSLEKNLELLGFVPDIYSPYFLLCTPDIVASLHQQNIQLIPWTVNEVAQMQALIRMGVDGIITDYPNRISTLAEQ